MTKDDYPLLTMSRVLSAGLFASVPVGINAELFFYYYQYRPVTLNNRPQHNLKIRHGQHRAWATYCA